MWLVIMLSSQPRASATRLPIDVFSLLHDHDRRFSDVKGKRSPRSIGQRQSMEYGRLSSCEKAVVRRYLI